MKFKNKTIILKPIFFFINFKKAWISIYWNLHINNLRLIFHLLNRFNYKWVEQNNKRQKEKRDLLKALWVQRHLIPGVHKSNHKWNSWSNLCWKPTNNQATSDVSKLSKFLYHTVNPARWHQNLIDYKLKIRIKPGKQKGQFSSPFFQSLWQTR